MRYTLAVDPGIRVAGAALFGDRQLLAAACIRGAKTGNGAAECAHMAREIIAWYRIKMPGLFRVQEPDEYVCEWPQIYTRDKSKGDPNDMIALAGIDSAVCALIPGAVSVSYKPAEWKHQVDGDAMTARILGRLERDEIGAIAIGCLRTDPVMYKDRIDALLKHSIAHNAIDAVGIGLHHLGRLERKRVFAR